MKASNAVAEVIQYLKLAQGSLSNAGSKYAMSRLYLGVGIALLALLISLRACSLLIADDSSTRYWMLSLALLFGSMMFASSYVEEEQHFWYWMLSGWLGWLWFTW